MRNELLAWFAREGLLLQNIITSADDPEHDEIKVTVKAPIIAMTFGSVLILNSSAIPNPVSI